MEQRIGTGPATADLDQQIAQVRQDKESAIDSQDFEQAGVAARPRKAIARRQDRPPATSGRPPTRTWRPWPKQVQRLSGEMERLRDLLRQNGIEPQDNTA